MSDQLFPEGVFDPQKIGDSRVAEVLQAAVERFGDSLRGSDVLHVVVGRCVAGNEPGIRAALEATLAEGAGLEDVQNVIDVYNPVGTDSYAFNGTAACFAPDLLAALADFVEAFAEDASKLRPVALELLLACVLDHPDALDAEYLKALDFATSAAAVRRRVRLHSEPPADLWDGASGRLRSEEFTSDAWTVLEQAARFAADLGYEKILVPHCLLALLAETEGLADRILRRQLPPQIGVAKATEIIASAFRLLERGLDAVPALRLTDVGPGLQERLRAAQFEAAAWGSEQVDIPHLLLAFAESPSERLAAVLRGAPLHLDLTRLRDHVVAAMRESPDAPREVAYKLPAFLPPAEDLTWLARTGAVAEARHVDQYFDAVLRALHRTTDHHVLITGLPGVGSTTVLRELARRAAAGDIPFLRRKRFVRVDGRDVAPENSAAQLSGLISHVGGRTELVLCVDGLGPLLRGPNGTRHNLILRGALKEGRVQLVGVLTGHDYEDLVAVDHELLELTSRVEIAEPDQAAAIDMVRRSADELADQFTLEISDAAVQRSVVLAGDFMPRHRLPQSAVKVLQRVCENADYARGDAAKDRDQDQDQDQTKTRAWSSVPRRSCTPSRSCPGSRPASWVARCGRPSTTNTCSASASPASRRRCALSRTSSGASSRGWPTSSSGPASVMLFAGLTGVGKTELAKAIADLYSASKRLQTYPMENFTEPHSVAAFLGPPPGYHGHDTGGRLINEMNADPYGVFLLDEAEKAHPEVLRPFLNLFDEGWIVDQRGVKAYGERAIFILTSNAGHEVIAKMAGTATDEEIAAAVRKQLLSLRNRQDEPVFTPEFLARIRRIVVFRPLGLAAMERIVRQKLNTQQVFWRQKREKELVVSEEVVRYAAESAHQLNSGGTKGGRVAGTTLSDLVEDPVLKAAEERSAEFQAATKIEVCFAPAAPIIEVRFHTDRDKGPATEADTGRPDTERPDIPGDAE